MAPFAPMATNNGDMNGDPLAPMMSLMPLGFIGDFAFWKIHRHEMAPMEPFMI